MNVTDPGRSGLRNAYRSVPSTCGSAATSGASRWLDALPSPGPSPASRPPPRATVAPRATAALRNRLVIDNEVPPCPLLLSRAPPPGRCVRPVVTSPRAAVTEASRRGLDRISRSRERSSWCALRGTVPRAARGARCPEEPPEHDGHPERERQGEPRGVRGGGEGRAGGDDRGAHGDPERPGEAFAELRP